MKEQSSYIYSIEGKDIILTGDNGYKTKKGKKFKGALDYSLLALKINELDSSAFYMGEKKDANKQFTKAIVNLTFEYAVKEFNIEYIDKNKVYVKLGTDTSNLVFENGVAIVKDEVVAVIVDKYVKTVDGELLDIIKDELLDAKGFTFKLNKKGQIKWLVDTSKFKTIKNADAIRTQLYEEGFHIDGVRYSRFIRSTGSSRQGRCLFVREDLLQPLNDWLYMGLNIAETDKIDELPALESYIALVTSSIIDTININPDEILIIEDFKSIFTDKVMETKITDNRLVTNINDNMRIVNNIWDGQSIADASIFGKCQDSNMYWVDGKYADKAFMLLRNRFFKSACFSANIQMFFSDNGITDISQLNGITLAKDVSHIKLITTKSSIKYCKFGSIMDWLKFTTSIFGLVKYEKPTHYFNGDMVQTHYQLINTLQLSMDDIIKLIKPSSDYIKMLKNDVDVLRYHLACNIQDSLDLGDINSTNDMIYTMLQINNNAYDTEVVDNFKQDIIDSYINNLRQGHILVPGTYSVLLGNPFEMLLQSIGKFDGTGCIDKNTIVCKHFENGQELVLTRSPHITMGNVMVATINNKYDWMKYFNLSKNIVCIDSIGENTLQRLQSADFDSDTVALINMPDTLLKTAKKNYNNFLVPTTSIEGEKNPMYNNLVCKAELDINTDSDLIGKIVNCSQVGNSILWNRLNNGASLEEVQELYKDICTLSVASGLAIDSAKKIFPINLELELKRISNKFKHILITDFGYNKIDVSDEDATIIYDNFGFDKFEIWEGFRNNFSLEYVVPILTNLGISEEFISQFPEMYKTYPNIKPTFFKYVSEEEYVKQGNYSYINFDTAMDYLQIAITKELKGISNRGGRNKGNTNIPLIKLLNKNQEIKISRANRDQINTIIIPAIEKYKLDSDSIWKSENFNSEEKYEQYVKLKQETESYFRTLKINIYTLKKLIVDISNGEHQAYARKLLNMLWIANRQVFISLLKLNRDNINTLVRSEDGDIDLYGIKFKKNPTHFACKC